MPVYEYRCESCKRKVAIYFRTFADVETQVPVCTHCQSADLSRLVSRVFVHTSWGNSMDDIDWGTLEDDEDPDPRAMGAYVEKVKHEMREERQRFEANPPDPSSPDFAPPSHTLEDVL